MGYYKESSGIECFTPDDAEDCFYIEQGPWYGDTSLSDIMEMAAKKWPDNPPGNIVIKAEYIHIRCLGYDMYDPSDYSNFLKIVKGP